MNVKPRGKCPYCGHKKALRKDGTLYKHMSGYGLCPGSGARAS